MIHKKRVSKVTLEMCPRLARSIKASVGRINVDFSGFLLDAIEQHFCDSFPNDYLDWRDHKQYPEKVKHNA